MTVNEIMKLLDAGYTKEEISALEAPAPEPEAKPEPAPAPDAEPKAKPEPAPAPDAEPTLADVLKKVAKLTATIQANALAQTQINGQPKAPTAEDMIAQIIRPTRKERDV
jgi:hypothetical protein